MSLIQNEEGEIDDTKLAEEVKLAKAMTFDDISDEDEK